MIEFIGDSQWASEVRGKRIPHGLIIITGEAGVGKTHMARFIHHNNNGDAPILIADVATKKDLSRELFGHTPFLGLGGREPGLFEKAKGGTIVIKDVDRVPPEVQNSIASFIQLDSTPRHVILTACKAKDDLLLEQRLLPELSQLIKTILPIPPLRKRREDIEALAKYFVQRWADELGLGPLELTRGALRLLKAASWPGNVAELKSTILRSLLDNRDKTRIEEGHIAFNWNDSYRDEVFSRLPFEEIVTKQIDQFLQRLGGHEVSNLYDMVIERVERPLIKLALKHTGGNQLKAARLLGINRNTLRAKLKVSKSKAQNSK